MLGGRVGLFCLLIPVPQISLDVRWAGRGGELSAILTCFGTLDTLLLDGRVGVVSCLLLNLSWYLRLALMLDGQIGVVSCLLLNLSWYLRLALMLGGRVGVVSCLLLSLSCW
jgi:hypothetical protein